MRGDLCVSLEGRGASGTPHVHSHEPETALLQAVKSRRMVTFEFAPEDATTHAAAANPITQPAGHGIASFKVMCDPEELDTMELEAEYEIVIRPLTE